MTSSFEEKIYYVVIISPFWHSAANIYKMVCFTFAKLLKRLIVSEFHLQVRSNNILILVFFFTRFTERRTITKQCIFEFLENLSNLKKEE